MDSEDTSAAARGRIMVVDDDIVATAILRAQLSPHFEVVSTNEPTAALALARESQPHVILCDINMPGMTGLELLQEVKQRWPNMVVIMVSAYGDADNRRRAPLEEHLRGAGNRDAARRRLDQQR